MMPRTLIVAIIAYLASAALGGVAFADPPARVGRIAYVEGDVSFQPPQQDEWTAAIPNFPMTRGEAFWTGDNGRVELQVGPIAASLDNETQVDVAALRYGEMRLALSQGSISLRIRGAPVGGVTVSTPAGDIRIPRWGFYRIDVGAPQDDGGYPPTEVTVFQGEAEAPGPEDYTPVLTGQAAVLYAGYDPQLQGAENTAIDDWARQRLREESWGANSPAFQGMTGAADLGRYGDFSITPEYGQVWFPHNVSPDWAPYREGRWAYVAPWGYTWIDDEPWGFAPFHYGRWALIDGRWGWVPGRRDAEPIYAPALVAFVGGQGWGRDISLGGGQGGMLGWIPLAPDEVFSPSYQVSDDYFRRANVGDVSVTKYNSVVVNRTVNTITANKYHNAPAATVVRAEAFRDGQAVRETRARIAPEVLARAPLVTPTVAIPPPQYRSLRLTAPGTPPRSVAVPPSRLAATRAAIVAPTVPDSRRPPMIAGARLTPPALQSTQRGATATLIAPAQARNPNAQHRPSPAPAPVMMDAPPLTPPSSPTDTQALDQAAAQAARRKARQEAAQKADSGSAQSAAGPSSMPVPAPLGSNPSSSSADPSVDPQALDQAAAQAARRKARQEAAQKAAAGAVQAPAAPASTPPPSSALGPNAPLSSAGAPPDVQAQAQAAARAARRKARQEAAQKAAAAASQPAQPPATQPHP